MSSFDLSEISRIISNLIRIGTVVELDEKNARVKVSVSGLKTDWIPWGSDSAGRVRKWSAKQIGEQVVLLSPNGDLSQAVVGHSLFQDRHPAPSNNKGQESVSFADGTTVDYNMKTNTFTMNVAGSGGVIINCKSATVKATGSVTLDSPEVHCTGHATFDKGISVTGDAIVTAGDVKADAISLKLHKTSGVMAGNGVSNVPVP